MTSTRIHDSIEQLAFALLVTSGLNNDKTADVAEHIAGFATTIALREVMAALYDAGAYGAIVAFEEAADDDMRKSRPCWTNSDVFEMWGASVSAKHELEAAEDRDPGFDPDDQWC